ncbi:tetratricopeptide (TPR) repeat protein [Pseudomonas sp. BIGb0408]|uniref:Tetratricopeptide (TPR) repeat protein n=1 Tax=Phytopseudomonas flavescens TaxID=29435 RepID=A0A7Y9XMT1_9GAMM|nr:MULTISPECIES: tetratricopeptide repeat protein [Pseudomonas]MCW2292395.1 tetratricopeptide (TPR) repeat protein [Pseudomonas sp. BIGb0408]NYH73034.1 tetratricopeptide (TPR) repeat protein [Pseudomonas flavescens]
MRTRDKLLPWSLLFMVFGFQAAMAGSVDKAVSLFEAEQYQASIQEADRVLEKQPDDSQALNIKALSVSVLGDDETAIRLVLQALEASRRNGQVTIAQQSDYWNNLGYFSERQRNFEAALGYHRKSLEMRLAAFGEKDLRTADSYNNIGTTLSRLGRYDEAFEYLNKNLTLRERLLGPDDHLVAVAVNNLGNAYNLKGDYERSLPLFEQALDIDLRLYGPEHPTIAARWNNVGDALRGQGRYDEAERLLNKALNSDLATFGENHPKVVLRYTNLARVYEAQGDTPKASASYAKALKILQQSYPGDIEQIDFLESKLKAIAAKSG